MNGKKRGADYPVTIFYPQIKQKEKVFNKLLTQSPIYAILKL